MFRCCFVSNIKSRGHNTHIVCVANSTDLNTKRTHTTKRLTPNTEWNRLLLYVIYVLDTILGDSVLDELPYNTPTVTVFNTRIPVVWYRHFERIATARKMAVHTYLVKAIRSKATEFDEQQLAYSQGISVTAVRQKILEDLHPDLPKWWRGNSKLRGNTPSRALTDGKSRSINNPKPRPRFSMEVGMSQKIYYDIKRIAAERHMEPEDLARKIMSHGFKTMKGINLEAEDVD